MTDLSTRTGFGMRFTAPVFIGSMLNPVNSTMIATALVPIGQSYRADPAATAWLLSALYLASSIAQPVLGRLADLFGARRVYVGGLVLVGVAGVGGALAPPFSVLVATRVLLGIGTSSAYPAAMIMLRQHSQRINRPVPGGALGALVFASTVSSTFGPALGGLLVSVVGWPSIFLVNVPLAAVGIATTLAWLPADPGRPRSASSEPDFDLAGMLVFAATITVLSLALMNLNWISAVAFVVLAMALVSLERRVRRPFLDLRGLTANGPLLRTYLRNGLASLMTYGTTYGIVQWLEASRGLSASVTGLLTVPMSVVAATCAGLGSRGRRVRGPLLIGGVAMLGGTVALGWLGSASPIVALLGVMLVWGVSGGLNPVGNQAAMYVQATADQAGVAAGLFRTAQYLGALTATSMIGLIYGKRVTDAGLHTLAFVLTLFAVTLLISVAADRSITSSSTKTP